MNDNTAFEPRSKGLPRPLSGRSTIDPFIVMDAMGEANLRQAGGEDIIHMEVGQPGTRASAARERARETLDG